MKVGDLVRCTMMTDQNIGLVIEGGERTLRVHFLDRGLHRANPRWISVEYLEVINESR